VSKASVASTDLIFIAGESNAQAMRGRFPEDAAKVQEVGNPRFDLLRSTLRPLYRAQADRLRASYGPFVLINTNLGLTNAEKGPTEEIIREQARLGKLDLSDPQHLAFIEGVKVMETANQAAIAELLKLLPAALPNHRIILRPHPAENLALWHAQIGQSSQIEVIRQGPAAPWIFAADVLVHTNCTTGVEAVALGKPAVCIVPTDVSVNGRYLSNRVNPVVRSAAEAIASINRIIEKPEDFRYSEAMLERFHRALSFVDDRLAATALIEAIEDRLATRDVSGPSWHPTWKYRWHQPDKNVRGKLMPSLDLGQVSDHLHEIRNLLQLRFDVIAEPCGWKLVHLSRRGLVRSVRWRRRLSNLMSFGRTSSAQVASSGR
jgi:surface carbohydrate biosynthesis protein